MKPRIRSWQIVIMALLVTIAAAVPIAVYFTTHITPKATLSSALNTAFSQLEMRVEGNPLLLVSRMLPWEGKCRAELEMTLSDDFGGEICCDAVMRVDLNTHRVLAEGRISSGARDVDMCLYMDSEYAALSSGDFAEGTCYGITYDTFSEDIRSFPLLEYLISEQMLQRLLQCAF